LQGSPKIGSFTGTASYDTHICFGTEGAQLSQTLTEDQAKLCLGQRCCQF
jgi:hypothetical protein